MNLSDVPDLRLDQGPPGSSALFGADNKHRYMLQRSTAIFEPVRRLVACGLNPSTADAFQDDPTVRREIDFARRWGCHVLVKVNAYAWRDTKPADMWRAADRGSDVVGVANDAAIQLALTQLKRYGGIALAAWGNHAKPARVDRLRALAREVGVTWMCLGKNKNGSPKHPLYVAAETELQVWYSP